MSNYTYYLYNRPWWESYYGDLIAFEYLSNKSSLNEYISKKSLFRQLAESLGKKVSITSIVNELLEIDLIGNKNKKTIIENVLEIYSKYDAQKTIIDWFKIERKKAYKDNRYFTSVSNCDYSSELPFFSSDITRNDSKFVIIQGSICHKETLRHNKPLYESVSHSKCQWVLCDFPPVAMIENNSNYDGSLLFLQLDDGFEQIFGERVPFSPEIGWFPLCTIGGFLSTRKITSQNFPTILTSIILYQRAISPTPNAHKLKEYVIRECRSPIHIEEFVSRIFLYYLVPTMYKSWGINYDNIDNEFRKILQKLIEGDKNLMDQSLFNFYQNQIFK